VRVYSDGSGASRLRQRVWDISVEPFMDWSQVCDSSEAMWHAEMDGQFIFRKAVAGMQAAARGALEECGLTLADVDWVVPHQANLNINKTVGSVLKLPPEKMLSNIDRVGNTTAASIPILLSESVASGRIRPGHRVLSLAFGSGLTWGAALLRHLRSAPRPGPASSRSRSSARRRRTRSTSTWCASCAWCWPR
jgi:3-oxoacyl-[acyl-carrier-protein] synthase-3